MTGDSAAGWLPSEALERQARQTATDYLRARDEGRFASAYAMWGEDIHGYQPLPAFTERLRTFNASAGRVIERRLVTVTWTNNPANAPRPGVYVAIDLVSKFAEIDRHCGYLVLYQAPTGGAFQVTREEETILTNAQARDIASHGSVADVDKAWASASAHCPGYSPPQIRHAPLAETTESKIGYPNVAAALVSLRAKPGVVISMKDGWTIATDDAENTFWSFPPPGHPAYPSAVKRQIVQDNGAVALNMEILCEAAKEPCDDLVRAFKTLNDQMRAALARH